MSEGPSFRDLIRRVRAGTPEAMAELERRYLPQIRRVVRARLTDPALRRLYDSADFCQSVLCSFFMRLTAGQYRLEEEAQLIGLLVRMARNKVIDKAEEQGAQKRGGGKKPVELADQNLPGSEPDPCDEASYKELVEKFRGCLSAEERRLADLRAQGWSWEQIAEAVGGKPDSLRVKLDRAIKRCMCLLGLEG